LKTVDTILLHVIHVIIKFVQHVIILEIVLNVITLYVTIVLGHFGVMNAKMDIVLTVKNL